MSKVEINKDSVYIDGVEYVKADTKPLSPNYLGDIKIVVLQRGWVFIGRYKEDANGKCTLSNAYNIREWGTTRGLPELCNGKTSSTKLDKCEGVVEFDVLTTICKLGVNESKWSEI